MKTHISKPEPTQVWRCSNGHQVIVRVHVDGSIRGNGVLICPRCADTELRYRP